MIATLRSGMQTGGHAAGAILYTVVESCRRRGIDPYEYLRDVLERLPSMRDQDLEELTPAGWAAAKAKNQMLAA